MSKQKQDALKKKRVSQKIWRDKNKEKLQKYHKEHKKEAKLYREEHKEHYKDLKKKHYEKNKVEIDKKFNLQTAIYTEMSVTAGIWGTEWKTEDELILINLRNDGLGFKEIGLILKRTRGACSNKYSKLTS